VGGLKDSSPQSAVVGKDTMGFVFFDSLMYSI